VVVFFLLGDAVLLALAVAGAFVARHSSTAPSLRSRRRC
jgi:hypothetical protein